MQPLGSYGTILIISNKEMEDIMKIVKYLEESRLLTNIYRMQAYDWVLWDNFVLDFMILGWMKKSWQILWICFLWTVLKRDKTILKQFQ